MTYGAENIELGQRTNVLLILQFFWIADQPCAVPTSSRFKKDRIIIPYQLKELKNLEEFALDGCGYNHTFSKCDFLLCSRCIEEDDEDEWLPLTQHSLLRVSCVPWIQLDLTRLFEELNDQGTTLPNELTI